VLEPALYVLNREYNRYSLDNINAWKVLTKLGVLLQFLQSRYNESFINEIRRLLKLGWLRNKKIRETQRRRRELGREMNRKGGQAAHNRITLISLSK
jgi:hypothetical protein